MALDEFGNHLHPQDLRGHGDHLDHARSTELDSICLMKEPSILR